MRWTWVEGSERLDYDLSGDGRLTRRHTSLVEPEIMAANARVRANGGSRSLSFGKAMLQMSCAQYIHLIRKFPALASDDKQEQTRAWQRLARDPEYRYLSVEDH